ncbi:MAG: hypothetical protein IBX55_20740 [Methyloprofundus sp.]|nr:hypothetical protein [Methyloprofundus sp.]MBW6452903.1 hypothetical protein [Methyloprofundus sp.]
MSIENLDYQAKIIAPTQQLFEKISGQANELLAQAKQSALELHAKVADTGLEFYAHPTETATRWQAEAIEKGNQLYATFNDNILPAVKADYEQLIVTLVDYGVQSRQSFQVFLDNPEQITVEAFTAFNQGLMFYLNKTLDISLVALNELSDKADEIISLLIAQPLETMEAFYYQSLVVGEICDFQYN